MEIWEAIVVGIVQGLAEFLPISSSGHIVLTQFLLGVESKGILFEVVLHVGTLLSVLVYFRKKLWNLTKSLWTKDMVDERKWILFLGLATLPAVALVLIPIGKKKNEETGELESMSIGDLFEKAYDNPVLVSGLLLVTGALLLAPKVIKTKRKELSWKTALFMGVGQAFAILPGISRSGSSITAGLLSGVKPEKAAEFAFLMSIPAIAGAVVKEKDAFAELSNDLVTPYLLGAVAAFLSGLFAVYLVLAAIRRGKFAYFAYYCFAAGILGMIWFGFVNTGWR